MKQLTVLLLLAVMLSLTGCQTLRGTTTPGNVAVAGEEAGRPAEKSEATLEEAGRPAEKSGAAPEAAGTPDSAEISAPPTEQTTSAVEQPAVMTSDKA